MVQTRQVLLVQGAGAGAYDVDTALVADLRTRLGPAYEVRYPRLPDEDDPTYAARSVAVRRAVDDLAGGAGVVGHSVGATILVTVLAEHPPQSALTAIVLVAAPFVGPGGWPGEEFRTPADLGARLPPGVPVHIVHGLQDGTVPPEHADLYGRAIPQASVHRLPGRDHQLGGDVAEIAEIVRSATAPG